MHKAATIDIPPFLVPYARRLALDDCDIFFYTAGPSHAPILLLLHGLGDDADTWRALIPRLAQHYRVIAPDLPGFGRSSPINGAYSLGALSRVMAAFINRLQLRQITLVGHSLGAMIAQRLSIGLPSLVRQQILISGCLPIALRWPALRQLPLLAPGLGEMMLAGMRRSRELAFLSLQPFYANLYELPAREQRFLRRRVWARAHHPYQSRATLSALRWLAIDSLFRYHQYLDRVRGCQTPTLIISGDRDRIIDGEYIEHMLIALEPLAQYVELERCGHMPQQEQPDRLCELIIDAVPVEAGDETESQECL